MKTSSFKQVWINFFLKPFIALSLLLATCMLFNFLLVPPLQSSIVETIMADANSQSENIDLIFMGSSRVYRSIDAPTLSKDLNKNVFNIAYENANYFTTYHLLKEISKENQLEMVFLEVSTTNFTRENSSEDKGIYRILTGENKEEFAKGIHLNYQSSKLIEFTNYLTNFANGKFTKNVRLKFSGKQKLGEAIKSPRSTYKGNGFVYAGVNVTSEEDLKLPKSYFKNGKFWEDSLANTKQVKYFHKIFEFCNQNDIEVILFSPPYPDVVTSEYQEDLTEFDNFVKETSKNYNTRYLDFSKLKEEHLLLSNDFFYNANHCNGTGASALEPILKNICSDLQNDNFEYSYYFNDTFTSVL